MALKNQHKPLLNFRDRLTAIEREIVGSLSEFNLSADYHNLLHSALFLNNQPSSESESKPWGLLPGLCCQAAGGEIEWADKVAASWLLFYAAADLIDSVQDQDDIPAWRSAGGSAVVLSAATGLFFWASSLLNKAALSLETKVSSAALVQDFHQSFLQMSSGQFNDICHPYPDLEQYWQIASEKSGSFFALACRSGARLALQDQEKLSVFGELGYNLGILVQVLDDLEDLNSLLQPEKSRENYRLLPRSLPFVYAFQVLPFSKCAQVMRFLEGDAGDIKTSQDLFNLIEESGATIYLLAQINRYRSLALEKLSLVACDKQARAMLEQLIRQLGAFNQN